MATDTETWILKCHDCNMIFGTPSLLQKHKERFCVGGQIGDPQMLLLHRGLRDVNSPPAGEPPDETETPRYDPSLDPRVIQLAEVHGRQMAFIQSQNVELLRQREEIRRQLEGLGRRQPVKDNSTDEVLRDLREQEARSQKLLEELRKQLAEARRPVNIIQNTEPAPEPEKKSYVYPVFHGNSLVAEIIAVRQAYIQNGGNDPEILAQLEQMLAEARALDESLKNAPKKPAKEKKEDTTQLFTVEIENERLQRQLQTLREQKVQTANKSRKDNGREDDLEREIQRMRHEHLRKMYELQREIERMRQDSIVDRMRLELQLQNQQKPQLPTRIVLQQPAPPPPAPAPAPRTAIPALPPTHRGPPRDVLLVPYDQHEGFVIFYDFVLNLESNISAVRLLVGLHDLSNKLGEPSVLPLVYTEPSVSEDTLMNICNAVIGARQPVPGCPAQSDLGIVAELQVAGAIGSNHDPTRLITRAWTKIPLFDGEGGLYVGRFKLPLRHSPIKPYIPFGELDDIAQYGDAELYYRVVHYRDASMQSLATIAATNRNLYKPAPVDRLLPHLLSPLLIPPSPPSIAPSDSLFQSVSLPGSLLSLTQTTGTTTNLTEPTIGFQVDRVKHSDLGEGKVRLTAYYVSTGEVVQSESNAVTCTTTSVKSNFKHEYHVFGQQEAVFNDIKLQGDMVLMAFFYLTRRPQGVLEDMYLEPSAHVLGEEGEDEEDEDTLVAWTALPLVLCTNSAMSASRHAEFDPSSMKVNTGTKTLPLYVPPVPSPTHIPLRNFRKQRDWIQYRNATLRLYIFCGEGRAGSLTPSDVSTDRHEVLPDSVWIPKTRSQPPMEPFLTGDGFDIYIDGCRYLPDSVTFTRVAARVLDRRYRVYGSDISTGVELDSDIFNPVYGHREEFREPSVPPSVTLLFKVYTMDKFYKRLTVVGYATLNVFVETGTEKQPSIDMAGPQISVNEGCHQLRLYSDSPDEHSPLTEACLRDSNTPIVPCASLLVRLYKVVNGPRGRPMQASQVYQSDWERFGLWRPRPRYSQQVYLSMKCRPTGGETKFFHSLILRTPVSVKKTVAQVSKARDSFLHTERNVHHFIRNELMKDRTSSILQQDLTFIAPYSPRHGFRCALYKAYNIPWPNFTLGHICLNPPGAFYQGVPHATYDKPVFTERLDVSSSNTCPSWQDGNVYYPRRSFHRYLCVIIHLQEIFVTSSKNNLKYGLLKQAWTAVQVFRDRYANVSTYQLPLISGGPSVEMLTQLTQQPCREWMQQNTDSGAITLVEGASVIFQLCDARHDEDSRDSFKEGQTEISMEYLPVDKKSGYFQVKDGKPLTSLVPKDQQPEEFMDVLAVKFKSLVYKLYEEGGIGNK